MTPDHVGVAGGAGGQGGGGWLQERGALVSWCCELVRRVAGSWPAPGKPPVAALYGPAPLALAEGQPGPDISAHTTRANQCA